MKRSMPGVFRVAIALSIIAVTAVMVRSIDPSVENSGDAYTNLVSAYNLAYHGVISQSRDPQTLRPGNYREPLPIVLLAGHIKLNPSLRSGHTPGSLNTGSALVRLKYLNVLLAVLCLIGIAVFTTVLLHEHRPSVRAAGAILAVILTAGFYFAGSGWLVVNEFTTELPASMWLIWASAAQLIAVRSNRLPAAAAAGALFGALALTSATFFYITVAVAFATFAFLVFRPSRQQRRQRLTQIGAAVAVLMAVIAPWVARNYVRLGEMSLTQRAGAVLLVRAYKNQMTQDEWLGGFYYYAPGAIKPLIGRTMGLSDADADGGGRLQRLNRERSSSFYAQDARADDLGRPDEAISYYRKWRAERTRLTRVCESRGTEDPMSCAEQAMREEAVAMLAASPLAHLRTTPLFLWRGLWTMSGVTWPLSRHAAASTIGFAFNAVAGLALLSCLGLGLLRGRTEALVIALIPSAAFALYALTTHFIPRYSAPLIPSMVVATVWTMTHAAGWCTARVWPNLSVHQLHESEA